MPPTPERSGVSQSPLFRYEYLMPGYAKLLLKILVLLGALVVGARLHEAVEEIASDRKLLLARALIWGSIVTTYSLWLAWRPIIRGLSRLAAQAEQSRDYSLRRRGKASLLERVLILLFLVLCVFATGLAIFAPDTFIDVFQEDGPFETGTVICYALSAGSCAVFALRAAGARGLQISLAFLTALFVLVGAEEISWGQRMFGFDTPERLAAVNVQGEFTLHNVYSISLFTYPALATTAMLLFFAPLLQSTSPDARRIFDAFGLPVAPPVSAILYGVMITAYLVVGFRLGTPTPLPITYSSYAPHYDDEMLEFLISALFAVFALSNWRLRLPNGREPTWDRQFVSSASVP